MPFGPVLRATTELAVRLDRVRPGVFDGPPPDPAAARRIAGESPSDPRELAVTAARLRRDLVASGSGGAPARYLDAQLVALRCAARLAAGEPVTWLDEVRDRFGVRPLRADPDRIAAAHRRLSDLLPGRGPLAARMRAHREADTLPPDRVEAAVRALTAELRARTHDALGLPADERAVVEPTAGRPWTALTRYEGRHRSRVAVDTAAGLPAGRLLPLLAHEIYPGHHTQSCRATAAAARHPVLGLRLVHSPQAVVAEGAAEAAVWVLPGPGWGRIAEEVLAGVGVRTDGELAEQIEAAASGLARVRQEAALLRHVDGAGPDVVVRYLSRALLIPDDRARRVLAFLDAPGWRGYPVTYAEGTPLVGDWLRRFPGGPVAGLARLLDSPVVPADLVPHRSLTEGGDTPSGAVSARWREDGSLVRPFT